jgi:hypothetical protein
MTENAPTIETPARRLNCMEREVRWWKRTATLLLVLGALLFRGPSAEAVPAAYCKATDKEPRSLTCYLGLDLWEEGKKSELIFQSWYLICSARVGHQVWCSLDRTLISMWGERYGALVSIHNHSTSDGSLKVWEFNLANWRVSFDVIYPSGERLPVLMRLKPKIEGQSRFLAVESFQAKGVVRDVLFSRSVVLQEWRLPEYSYTLNVPIILRGKKSTEAKARADMMKKLSTTDRQAYERIGSTGGAKCFDVWTWLEQEPLKTLLAPYNEKLKEVERQQLKELKEMKETGESRMLSEADAEQQRITKEMFQKEEVKTFLHNKMRQCLAEAGMSREGAELVTRHVLQSVFPVGERDDLH